MGCGYAHWLATTVDHAAGRTLIKGHSYVRALVVPSRSSWEHRQMVMYCLIKMTVRETNEILIYISFHLPYPFNVRVDVPPFALERSGQSSVCVVLTAGGVCLRSLFWYVAELTCYLRRYFRYCAMRSKNLSIFNQK